MSKRKHNLYKKIKEQNYILLPFAVETFGSWCEEAVEFTDELGKLIIASTGEIRSNEFLKKNISLAIQRGDAASVMGCFDTSIRLDKNFYSYSLNCQNEFVK